MAKSHALTRFAPRPIIVNVPRRSGRVRRFGGAVARGGRRVGRFAARHGKRALPTMAVAIGGLVAGYANGKGFLDKLPPIAGSRMNTIALVGWGLTRFTKNPSARAAGLAMLGAATFAIGTAQAGGAAQQGGAQGDDGGGGAGGGMGRPY